MAGEDLPRVAAAEAIAFFRAKGLALGFDWRDVWQGEHARAFTVAKAMNVDLLQTIREALQDALAEGTTLADFAKRLRPELAKRGWWGRRSMVDPLTGEQKIVQLGSPRRLKVIFNTNMRTAYQAGRWERIQRTKKAFPYLRYVSVLDGREREEHHAWHGTILPVDHPWWDTHYGPCDWGCRCTATPLNQRMVERRGWNVSDKAVSFPLDTYTNPRTGEVSRLEQGIGPGWSYNVGKSYLDPIAPAPLPDNSDDSFTASAADAATAFVAGFGGEQIWRDAGGWPLAISAGWFRQANGDFTAPRGVSPAVVGRALREADAIGWTWIRDRAGRPLMMRRYLSAAGSRTVAVDVGRLGWRATTGITRDRLERGMIAVVRPGTSQGALIQQ